MSKKLTKEALLTELARIHVWDVEDPEKAHSDADKALLVYIGDDAVTEAYNNIKMY